MRIYIINLVWLSLIFLAGCATFSQKKWREIDRRIVELSQTTHTLGKKIDDLSRSVSLLVSDGNELHNELDNTKITCKDNRQKVEDVEIVIRNLNGQLESLETDFKAAVEEINKRIDAIEKAEIELSDRSENLRLDMKGEEKENTISPSLP